MAQKVRPETVRRLLADGKNTVAGALLAKAKSRGQNIAEVAEAAGLGVRSAYNLIRLAALCQEGWIAEDDIQRIGPTKALMIAEARFSPRPRRRAVIFAEQHPISEIKIFLKTGRSVRMQTRVFQVPADEAQVIDQALERCGAKRGAHGLTNAGEALLEMARQLTRLRDEMTPAASR